MNVGVSGMRRTSSTNVRGRADTREICATPSRYCIQCLIFTAHGLVRTHSLHTIGTYGPRPASYVRVVQLVDCWVRPEPRGAVTLANARGRNRYQGFYCGDAAPTLSSSLKSSTSIFGCQASSLCHNDSYFGF